MPSKNSLRLPIRAPITQNNSNLMTPHRRFIASFVKKKKTQPFYLTSKSPLCSTPKLSVLVVILGIIIAKPTSCFTHCLASATLPSEPAHCVQPQVLHRQQTFFLGGEFSVIKKARRFTFIVTAGRKSFTSTQSTLKRMFSLSSE